MEMEMERNIRHISSILVGLDQCVIIYPVKWPEPSLGQALIKPHPKPVPSLRQACFPLLQRFAIL
jgi:hypothetical protein